MPIIRRNKKNKDKKSKEKSSLVLVHMKTLIFLEFHDQQL